MSFFHDDDNGDPQEPVIGLPEALPAGEKILWQGQPSTFAIAVNAFRLRWVLAYFAIMTMFRVSKLSADEASTAQLNEAVIGSLIFCAGALLIIYALAFAISRAAMFTITSERVILRHGFAIRKYVNAPFETMHSAQLKLKSARVGDISLQFDSVTQPPFLHLWPFVKPFTFSKPEPMLRGVRDPQNVAKILANAAFDRAPEGVKLGAVKAPSPAHVSEPNMGAVPTASAT